ncbi:hypothetical protein RGAI101_2677 [Roseobacter sp. GAI101]|nr:hypothetical protein RGAI101_2677 [Roseobacter sp. GAI101]
MGTTKDTIPATTTLNTAPIKMPPIKPRAIEKSLLFISSVKRGSDGRLPLTMGLKPEHVMTIFIPWFSAVSLALNPAPIQRIRPCCC